MTDQTATPPVSCKIYLDNCSKVIGKVHPIPGHEGPGGEVELQLYTFFNLGAR